jgi:hypothetical protein
MTTSAVDNRETQEKVIGDHAGRRLPDRWAILFMASLLLAYAAFLAHYYAPAISHPDSNGYWVQSTLIAEEDAKRARYLVR